MIKTYHRHLRGKVADEGVDNSDFCFHNVCNIGGEERSSRKEQRQLAASNINKLQKDPKCWEYTMSGHARTAVERYFKLAEFPESSLKKVGTPCGRPPNKRRRF